MMQAAIVIAVMMFANVVGAGTFMLLCQIYRDMAGPVPWQALFVMGGASVLTALSFIRGAMEFFSQVQWPGQRGGRG